MTKQSARWLGGLSLSDLASKVWESASEDQVFGRSAELSYYFVLALIPLLVFLTSLAGLILGSGTAIRHQLLDYLAQVMPSAAFTLIDSTIYEVTKSSTGTKLWIGILAALWVSSSGVDATASALNSAFKVKESRPWWRRKLTSLMLTLALGLLMIATLSLFLAGGRVGQILARLFRLGDMFDDVWPLVQWPLILAFILLAFALIYFFAPDVRAKKWRWISPGSLVAVLLWFAASFGFRLYLHFFDSYSKTYGSLGAVVVLMLWLYLTGAAILFGGEVNAVIDIAKGKTAEPEKPFSEDKAVDAQTT